MAASVETLYTPDNGKTHSLIRLCWHACFHMLYLYTSYLTLISYIFIFPALSLSIYTIYLLHIHIHICIMYIRIATEFALTYPLIFLSRFCLPLLATDIYFTRCHVYYFYYNYVPNICTYICICICIIPLQHFFYTAFRQSLEHRLKAISTSVNINVPPSVHIYFYFSFRPLPSPYFSILSLALSFFFSIHPDKIRRVELLNGSFNSPHARVVFIIFFFYFSIHFITYFQTEFLHLSQENYRNIYANIFTVIFMMLIVK